MNCRFTKANCSIRKRSRQNRSQWLPPTPERQPQAVARGCVPSRTGTRRSRSLRSRTRSKSQASIQRLNSELYQSKTKFLPSKMKFASNETQLPLTRMIYLDTKAVFRRAKSVPGPQRRLTAAYPQKVHTFVIFVSVSWS